MALKPEGEDAAGGGRGGPEGGTGGACTGAEERVESLEEARKIIKHLRERNRAQAQQILAYRRKVHQQEDLLDREKRQRQEQLKGLSSQLLWFQAGLCRRQKDISRMLIQREAVIVRQQRAIQMLQARLADAGLDTTHPDLDSPTGETNLDSLNDSDSAVIMEDGPGYCSGSDHETTLMFPRFRGAGDGVTVVRSISDAVETPSAKYASLRRSNGYLRRPEVLETVYSVEEDGDGDGANSNEGGGSSGHSEAKASELANGSEDCPAKESEPVRNSKADSSSSIDDVDESSSTTRYWGSWTSWSSTGSGRLQALYGSFERLAHEQRENGHNAPANHVTTYNRVMSNHRSVTKPKDVKYKRINKAKSKSLEELRGRLRNWVDKGAKVAMSLDQSSYA